MAKQGGRNRAASPIGGCSNTLKEMLDDLEGADEASLPRCKWCSDSLAIPLGNAIPWSVLSMLPPRMSDQTGSIISESK